MSWFDVKEGEHLFRNYGWFDPKSQPVKTLLEQKNVTIENFFTQLGKFFLGLK